MEYVRFGSSGLRVSRLALGLGLRDQNDEAAAERLIRRAHDGGINLFDCANVYGLGDDRRRPAPRTRPDQTRNRHNSWSCVGRRHRSATSKSAGAPQFDR